MRFCGPLYCRKLYDINKTKQTSARLGWTNQINQTSTSHDIGRFAAKKRSFSAKKPYNEWLCCEKLTCNFRYPMGLRRPVHCFDFGSLRRCPHACAQHATTHIVMSQYRGNVCCNTHCNTLQHPAT